MLKSHTQWQGTAGCLSLQGPHPQIHPTTAGRNRTRPAPTTFMHRDVCVYLCVFHTGSEEAYDIYICVCACVCVCARACVYSQDPHSQIQPTADGRNSTHTMTTTHAYVCLFLCIFHTGSEEGCMCVCITQAVKKDVCVCISIRVLIFSLKSSGEIN